MSFIESTSDEIAKYIHPGQLIVLESTTYPGTTREILLPKVVGGITPDCTEVANTLYSAVIDKTVPV